MIKVILKEGVAGLGKAGDVKQVKDGFARNFLFPKKLALSASDNALKQILDDQKKKEARRVAELRKAEALAAQIKNLSLTMTVDVNEDEKMYGSLTAQDIAKAMAAEGVPVDKKAIALESPIKELGIYDVQVKCGADIAAVVKVWVVKK
jgi:large subunit ribosomal protein L9